ncbi:Os12g0568750 [Oryza sativa Japonica Group]|uniref:Os12g0568750 protein n=1 Tax=Oryza sativa subsp. japonica TaxID=39947 RepID=A0A0P0YBI4_ORYSJ|nr:hypothetical protein EE612_060359 [Oryza sativa]BAT17720.1 Os12g0568750 [Oryza sativa Japonica Group]
MEPKAYVAASLCLQSGFVMFSSTKGITRGTISSPTVLATRPKQVPPAIARFQAPSSKSWSSSCLRRVSSSIGTKAGSACLIK